MAWRLLARPQGMLSPEYSSIPFSVDTIRRRLGQQTLQLLSLSVWQFEVEAVAKRQTGKLDGLGRLFVSLGTLDGLLGMLDIESWRVMCLFGTFETMPEAFIDPATRDECVGHRTVSKPCSFL